jgi:hypothetical protein
MNSVSTLVSSSGCCTSTTTDGRFVSGWTVPSKVSCPVPACLSTLSSPAMDHPVKLRPQACVVPRFARPWVSAAFLVLCHPPPVPTHLSRLPVAATALDPDRCRLTCKDLPAADPTATLLNMAPLAVAPTATRLTPPLSAQCLPAPTAAGLRWLLPHRWVVPGPTRRTRSATCDEAQLQDQVL